MIAAKFNMVAKKLIPMVVYGLVMTVASTSLASETMKVTLKNGQSYVAEIDTRTNAQQLWVRFEHQGTKLVKPIAWNQVEDVQIASGSPAAMVSAANSGRTMADQVLAMLHN